MSAWRSIRPSRKWLALPPVFIGAFAVAASAQLRKELPRLESTELARPLPVVRIQPRSLAPTVTGFGVASAARRWGAVSEVQGRIVQAHLHLRSGNAVEAGALLVRIDATDSKLLLSQRQADLDSARAKLQELEAGHESDQQLLALARQQALLATREEQRLVRLHQTRAVTESEIDTARSNRLAQEQEVRNIQRSIALYPSQVSGAKASVALAEVRVKEAERDIERTCIYSPFAGVLSGVELEVGQFVGVNEPLFELLDDQRIEVTAQFSPEQIEKLLSSSTDFAPGSPDAATPPGAPPREGAAVGLPFSARVVTRSGAFTRTWTGRPVRIAESLNEQSRTLGVVVQVLNPQRVGEPRDDQPTPTLPRAPGFAGRASALRPGTFCEVVLQSRPHQDLIAVPRTAVDGDSVYVVDDDNRLRPRQVVAGFSFAGDVAILRGLKPGDRVATVAPVPAIAGQLVEPLFDEAHATPPRLISSAAESVRVGAEGRRQ